MSWKWLPNAISVSRAFPLSVLIFVCAHQGRWTAAAILSVVAIASDPIDGWLAVKLDARSKFGVIVDPICDFAFTLAQVAGAFFAGIIGWGTIAMLGLGFVLTWPPVMLTKSKEAKKIALAINRTYYVGVAAGFIALYFYKAFGASADWLIIPALPLSIWGARVSMSHH